jgi:LuxR family maltose regulon positive regulatory protein
MSSPNQRVEPITLLRTKLHRPRVRDDLVPRPRLLEHLDRGLDQDGVARPLTLVCAPAGFGKTTLLTQWLADAEGARPAAWLSLDENDNDLALFLSYVIAAVQTVSPEACAETSALLQAPQTPPQDYLATILINEITELPEPLVLVLDDYHKIQDQAVHQLVRTLVGGRLTTMHLVLAGRVEPPFALAQLRVGGQMTEIRAEDLRFSLDEASAFFVSALGKRLSDEAITLLEQRTEGWIAGLRLAGLSMRGEAADAEAFVRRFKGTHRNLADYLVAEVLAYQSPAVQEFLLRTSILDRFCAPLCDSILDEGRMTNNEEQTISDRDPSSFVLGPSSGSRAMLDYLDRANLFLVPLDDERDWYRYHHLFKDLLRNELRARVSAGKIAALQRSASAWCADQGLTPEALQYALAAGDVAEAAQLVEEKWYEVLNREDWRTLERWLDMLPDEITRQQPGLLVARAWTIMFRFRLQEIEALLKGAEAGLDRGDARVSEGDEEALRGAIDALRSYTWRVLHDDVRRSLACAERALTRLPATFAIARGIALDFQCLAYQGVGRKEEAVKLLTEALNAPTLHGAARMQAFIALSLTHILGGDLKQLDQSASRFLEQAIQERQPASTGWAHYLSGQVRYEWNDLEAAARHFSAVADRRHSASFITVLGSMLSLARVRLAQGRPDQAQETLASLREHALKVIKTASLPEMDAFEAWLALAQGDGASAAEWARSFHPHQAKEPFSVLYPPSLTRNGILIAQGTRASLGEAVRHLQEQLAAAEERHNTRRAIQIRAHLALAYDAQGKGQDALRALQQAVALARPGGFIRTFVDPGPEMAYLLRQLAERGVEPDYVRRILAAFPETQGAPEAVPAIRQGGYAAVQAELVEPLTGRELEVLQLLGRRLSDQEIAQTLSISVFTAKTHARNIYQKLGVSGRKQVVAKARSLGILL